MSTFPYSIPEHRALSKEERDIVRHVVTTSCPERAEEVDALRVFARCGCGKCPTIMFHSEPERRKKSERLLADFQGGDIDSALVGIMLWERDGQISELEAWSIDGHEILGWPPQDTIRPAEISRRT
jgi:hypothetical protein